MLSLRVLIGYPRRVRPSCAFLVVALRGCFSPSVLHCLASGGGLGTPYFHSLIDSDL